MIKSDKKLTRKQETILSVLKNDNRALSAADIYAAVKDTVDQATVYRTLDKLTEQKLIKKLVLDGKKALYEHVHESHHHAVCQDCEEVIHFHIDNSKLNQLVTIPNFAADDIEIIVRGKHK